MFGEGGNHGGGGGGQKGGKLLARIGRAATFRGTTGEEQGRGEEQNGEQGRRRRGWLKHFGLSSKASKNKSEVVVEGKRAEGIGEVEEGRWGVGEVVTGQGRGVQGAQVQGGSRLMQLGQKLESSDDSGRESGYTRSLNTTIISSKVREQIKYLVQKCQAVSKISDIPSGRK